MGSIKSTLGGTHVILKVTHSRYELYNDAPLKRKLVPRRPGTHPTVKLLRLLHCTNFFIPFSYLFLPVFWSLRTLTRSRDVPTAHCQITAERTFSSSADWAPLAEFWTTEQFKQWRTVQGEDDHVRQLLLLTLVTPSFHPSSYHYIKRCPDTGQTKQFPQRVRSLENKVQTTLDKETTVECFTRLN